MILGKPLGVGVFSAALKQEQLSPEGYEMMIGSTTLLNRPGADIAEIDGVHAMTDVTGFGLLGHLAEICRGSGVAAAVEESAVPVFDLARNLLQEGIKTGASGRNWNSVKQWVEAPADWPEMSRDMLTDPQTSGGLLVSCAPEAADAVLTAFRHHGHGAATVIGAVTEGAPKIRIG